MSPGDEKAATSLLFVYGTLRRGSRHPMARLLALNARYVGTGYLNGRLYHLGRYPGAVASSGSRERVHGDLYEMMAPQKLLARLDRYEGLDRGRKRLGEYQRQVVDIRLDTGTVFRAWVYFYSRTINHKRRMVTGDYLRQYRRSPEPA